MNSIDRHYLSNLMAERINYHVELHKPEYFPNSEQFYELEGKYNEVLSVLPEDKAAIVREYIQSVLCRQGMREILCFRFGLRDGYHLAEFLHELTR